MELLFFVFVLFVMILGIFLQRKIARSQNKIILKSIGNLLLITVLQFLSVVLYVLIVVTVQPLASQYTPFAIVVFIYYLPLILMFNLIFLIIVHFIFIKLSKK